MAGERPDEPGVLGNLPRGRPGIASPRREQARRSRGDRGAAEAFAPPPEPGPSGFEELARAGVSLATGTAAAGLSLAGRAIGRLAGRR